MELRLKHIALHIDWLMLLFPCIAAALGEGQRILLLIFSLAAHESAHLLASKLLRIRISHLRLTPFGAMARIDNPYAVAPGRLLAASAAGPAANLAVILLSASFCHWRLLSPVTGMELIQLNLLLMLFNLLPALPLDGGRMLYALLTMVMPRRSAVNIGLYAGRILAVLLLLLPVIGFAVHGRLNLSPIFAALFLLASAQDERSALTDSRIRTLMDCLRPIDQPIPTVLMAIDSHTSAEAALQSAVPDKVTLFAVYDRGQFVRFVDDRTLLHSLLEESSVQTAD